MWPEDSRVQHERIFDWTEPTGRTEHEIREVAPTHCPAGHELKPGSVLITSTVHTISYLCRRCGLRTDRSDRYGESVVQASPC